MSSNEPAASQPSRNTAKIILTVVIVVVVVCVVIPCCVFALLSLMGPQIANIFSKVTSGLNTP